MRRLRRQEFWRTGVSTSITAPPHELAEDGDDLGALAEHAADPVRDEVNVALAVTKPRSVSKCGTVAEDDLRTSSEVIARKAGRGEAHDSAGCADVGRREDPGSSQSLFLVKVIDVAEELNWPV